MSVLRTTSVCGSGEFLFLNEDLSDVHISVTSCGSTWRFPAHSLMLSAQSAVFRCMLSSNFCEKESRQILIDDISPSTVKRLLQYFYSGKIELENWEEAIELLKAAHKYQVEPLVQKCAKFLENVVTLSNVCYIYNEATIYSMSILKDKCLRLILDAGFIILRTKTFEILSKESILEIVTNSSLNLDSELTVFEALLRWAPMQCCRSGKEVTEANILLELQPFLQHVCFDDMSDTDKSALPASILSCVKPNNRNRIGFAVLEALLPYAYNLNFALDQLTYTPIGGSLNCFRFSIDAPIYLIGLNFVMLATDVPPRFQLNFVKEAYCDTTLFNYNLSTAAWTEGIRINEKRHHETTIMLRQPVHLEEKTVYKMYCDNAPHAQCFKTQMVNNTIFTTAGHIHISVHSEGIWGVTSLVFI